MAILTSNGLPFLVIEDAVIGAEDIRLAVYDGSSPESFIALLHETYGRKWTDPLRGVGVGEFTIRADHPHLAALEYGNIIRCFLGPELRYAWTIEKKQYREIGQGENAHREIVVSGRGLLARLEGAVVKPTVGGEPPPIPTGTAGSAMAYLIDEAQARGALTGISYDFTDAVDSNAAPYALAVDQAEPIGDDLLRVAERHAEVAVDVYMSPLLVLSYYNERGIDRTDPESLVGSVQFDIGHTVRELERTEEGIIRNSLLVETALGYFTQDSGDSITEWGRQEAYLQLGNVADADQVLRSVQQLFLRVAQPSERITLEVASDPLLRPYEAYDNGDYVLAPDKDGNRASYRVVSITIEEQADGYVRKIPELATLADDQITKIDRWLKAMAKGTVSGEASTVATPTTGQRETVQVVASEAAEAEVEAHLIDQPHIDDHGALSGKGDDDHPQYSLVDGSRDFTAAVGGVTPSLSAHLATKGYVDGRSLDDLADVNAGAPDDGQALIWDDGAGEWTPGDVAAGGGGGGGTPILLGEVVLTAPATSMAIDDIPAGYGDLMIVAQIRSSRASEFDTVHIRFGGAAIDSGSNYDFERIWDGSSEGMSGSDSATTIQLDAQISGANAQAGYFGQVHGTIAAYDNPATYRHGLFRVMHRRTGGNYYVFDSMGVWKNTTDAIQRMLLWVNDGVTNIEAGSFVRVYGMNGSAGGGGGDVTPIPPDDASLVANLLVWLDADQITGLVDGDTVSPWADESGNGNDFTVATGTPQYKTGIINGLPVVRFSTAGMASPASLLSAEPFSIFYVYAPTGTRRALQGSSNWLLGPYDGTGEDAWYSGGWATDLVPGTTWRVHGVTQPASGTGYHFNRPIGAAAPTFPQSAVSVQSAGRANPGVPGTLCISRAGAYSGEGCNMDLAELIVFDRELTYDEGIGLIQYLVDKYEA